MIIESHRYSHIKFCCFCLSKTYFQAWHVSLNGFPQLLGERKFRSDIHPACKVEQRRVFMDKQVFSLTWDFDFDHSKEMEKKY